jgi:UDP-N-acetyl-D-mannosaminuronic acid transferase (WecB/TagA/CpsF family)
LKNAFFHEIWNNRQSEYSFVIDMTAEEIQKIRDEQAAAAAARHKMIYPDSATVVIPPVKKPKKKKTS